MRNDMRPGPSIDSRGSLDPVLDVADVRKAYGDTIALDGITLTVHKGEIFGVLGPNGAGKTTLTEASEGYRSLDSGHIKVLGSHPKDSSVKRRIGVMLQEGGIYPSLKAREVVDAFAAFYPTSKDPATILDAVGLADKGSALVRSLSGGQKQRLSLALALVGNPELAFLDEPTSAMDPHARRATHEIIKGLSRWHKTVFMTTHLIEEAEYLCDRIAIIDKGRLLALGSPSELKGPPSLDFTVEGSFDLAALGEALGTSVKEISTGHFSSEGRVDPKAVADLTQWLADRQLLCSQLTTTGGTLEDAYMRLVEV